jgi:hypothetical protein
MATEKMMAALQHELAARADRGAGLAGLLEHLHRSNQRFARRNRLSEDQLDELSLHCWSLQRSEASKPRWDDTYAGHASELWDSYRTVTSTVRARSPRRARQAA